MMLKTQKKKIIEKILFLMQFVTKPTFQMDDESSTTMLDLIIIIDTYFYSADK